MKKPCFFLVNSWQAIFNTLVSSSCTHAWILKDILSPFLSHLVLSAVRGGWPLLILPPYQKVLFQLSSNLSYLAIQRLQSGSSISMLLSTSWVLGPHQVEEAPWCNPLLPSPSSWPARLLMPDSPEFCVARRAIRSQGAHFLQRQVSLWVIQLSSLSRVITETVPCWNRRNLRGHPPGLHIDSPEEEAPERQRWSLSGTLISQLCALTLGGLGHLSATTLG